MAKLLKLRRGTTTQHSSFAGAEGEVTVDTDKDTLVVHDGSTNGGHPIAAEDMSNVTAANIKGRIASTITNTEINSSAAIAGTKINPYFGSQNISTTGTLGSGDITISSNAPSLYFTEGDADPDYQLLSNGGNFRIYDVTNTTDRIKVNTDGHVDIPGNLDCGAGIDVTGNITATGTASTGQITAKSVQEPQLIVQDSDTGHTGNAAETGISFRDGAGTQMGIMGFSNSNDSDYYFDTASTGYRMNFRVGGTTTQLEIRGGECNFDSDIILQAGHTVDGRDVAADGTLLDGLTASAGVLSNGVTGTTQAQSDNSTKVSTTAYVRTAISEAQAFPSGTQMLFRQTSAPTGWTKITSGINNHALRVVSGSVGSGGNVAFTTAFAARGITGNSGNTTAGGNISVANSTAGGNISVANATAGGNVNNHTLTTSQMPSHSHNYARCVQGGNTVPWQANFKAADNGNGTTSNTGGGGAHSHGFSGSAHSHNASFSGSAHSHNASFSGSAHNHSISIDNLDMQVEYLDVIIASKD